MNKLLTIEVVYANPQSQHLLSLQVEVGSTLESAIVRSGILQIYPEINLIKQKIGVFGKPRQLQDLVQAGDRIEIYRPLLMDPKEIRRAKARKLKR